MLTTFYVSLTRLIYTFVYYLVIPGILLRLLWKSRHNTAYRQRISERFGYVNPLPKDSKSIWIHGVSVGEILAAVPLIKALKEKYPKHPLIVTSSTITGSEQVIKQLGQQVIHYYAPYDTRCFVKRFLRRNQIKLCIIMETELWPNLLQSCKNAHIPVLLANARLSERSKNNYRRISNLTKSMLDCYTMVAAQGLLDGERFISLGLDPQRLMISGNIKFDLPNMTNFISQGKELRKKWQTENRPTLIAASTHEHEEAIVLQAFKIIREKIPHLLLIIVPRHPERFSKVAKLCEQQGFQLAYRSKDESPHENISILLGDTMGELRLIYAACDIAFVGGSLVNIGGHNLIEPAALGLPVLTGPFLQNFVEISKILKEAGIVQIVEDASSLAASVNGLLSVPEFREKISRRSKEVITANQGAVAKHLEWISYVWIQNR